MNNGADDIAIDEESEREPEMDATTHVPLSQDDDQDEGPIYLPWRSFKAFVTLWEVVVLEYKLMYRERTLAASITETGDKIRAPLVKNRLIEVNGTGRDMSIRLLRGTPWGHHTHAPGETLVCPDTGSGPGLAWVRSIGRCYYCGEQLRFFSQLAFHSDSGFFACKVCHGTKGTRTLEEFRFIKAMDTFEAAHGVRFDRQQFEWLIARGAQLPLGHQFYFETKPIRLKHHPRP